MHVFAAVRFGLQILRWCGPLIFLQKVARQLYGRTILLMMVSPLDSPYPSSPFRCTAKLASPEEVDELFRGLRRESPAGRYELLIRKWYHELGFGDCYIAIATDTSEICAVLWLVTPEHVKRLGWENRSPLLEGEVMVENIYVLRRYRRTGVHIAFGVLMREIARQLGYKRIMGYADEGNIPQIGYAAKAGNKICARVLERHLLFRVTRKTLERFDPPIPMKVPPGSQ